MVWRFLDLPKFLSILHRRELWFSCPNKFPDPWDGHYPSVRVGRTDIEKWVREEILQGQNPLDEVSDEEVPDEEVAELVARVEQLERSGKEIAEFLRNKYAVSCWHISPHEPDAFWTLYSDRSFGVAIKSSVGRLKTAFRESPRYITMGPVTYRRLEEPQLQLGILKQFFWKRLNFEYEREFRLVVPLGIPQTMLGYLRKDSDDYELGESGASIPVDVPALIDAVVVSPLAPKWFEDSVQALAEHFDKSLRFEPSALRSRP